MRRSRISAQLLGRTLRRVDSDGLDVTLWLTADDEEDCGLRAPFDHCTIVPADPRTEGLDPDERTLLGLHGLVFGLVDQIRWGDDGALMVLDSDGRAVRFAAEWPGDEEGWRLIDPAGNPRIEAGNGGALRVARQVESNVAGNGTAAGAERG